MEAFPTQGWRITDQFTGLYNHEVHAESIERHRDGRIGLANTAPSPSCSIKSPELLSYTSGASELQFRVPPAEGSRGQDGHWWGSRDRLDVPALKVFMRFKTFFLPLQTYTLLSWAAINRVVLTEKKETKTKPENKKPSL